MKLKTYRNIRIVTAIALLISTVLEGYSVFGPGSRKLYAIGAISFGVFLIFHFVFSALRNRLIKQDSDQAVK